VCVCVCVQIRGGIRGLIILITGKTKKCVISQMLFDLKILVPWHHEIKACGPSSGYSSYHPDFVVTVLAYQSSRSVGIKELP
jgi:hypothetical protein